MPPSINEPPATVSLAFFFLNLPLNSSLLGFHCQRINAEASVPKLPVDDSVTVAPNWVKSRNEIVPAQRCQLYKQFNRVFTIFNMLPWKKGLYQNRIATS